MHKRILLIEDEEPIVRALYKILGSHGYEMSESLSGEEGLKVALETHPDMIMLDIVLPKMNGLDVLRRLREDSWGKNAPVFIMTNLMDEEKEKEARALGVLDYLEKSTLSVQALADRINGVFAGLA
jgi:DNA-binding response OmpR family regulator